MRQTRKPFFARMELIWLCTVTAILCSHPMELGAQTEVDQPYVFVYQFSDACRDTAVFTRESHDLRIRTDQTP